MKIDETAVITDDSIRIDTFHAGEHSGFVHTSRTAVRITHLPTGVTVESRDEPTAWRNRQKCLDMLPAAIAQHRAAGCTCPSGDGSLRHPCPAHIGPFDKLVDSPVHNESEPDLPPLDEHLAQVFETGMALSESVEQAGGDERAVDGKPRATKCPDCGEGDLMPGDLCACGYETDPAAGYACSECDGSGDGYVGEVCRECDGSGWFVTPEQARAALAQPSPMRCLACGGYHGNSGLPCPNMRVTAQAQPSPTLPPFAEKVLAKLRRFNECAEDSDSGGVDIGRHWLDLLTQLGLLNRVQRSPALWEISQQGEDLLGLDVPEIEVPDSMIEKAWQRFERTLQQLETPGQAEQAEQAEAERPEVVGYCNPGHIERLKQMEITGFLVHEEESASISERLMTVAQHERIVGALRAEIAEWQEAAGRGRSDVVAYIAERAKLLEGRDAALARVAELEAKLSDPTAVHQWQFSNAWFDGSEEVVLKAGKEGSPIRTLYTAPPAQAQQLHDLDKQCRDDVARALGLRPSQERGFAWSYLLASIKSCVKASEDAAQAQHSVPEISGIGRDAEHPRAVVLYLRNEPSDEDMRAIQNFLRAMPADVSAKAQHSVPEGWKLVPIEPLFNMMSDKDHDTRITAERQLLSILADAPGNLVPQAWLDVQAERRRQITAEGWTPEHDDLYCAAELPRAAAAYILNGANDEAPAIWPFSAKWWKPRDARANYVRAGALILAEIERLDRAAQSGEGGAA